MVKWDDEKEPSAEESYTWMTQYTAEIPSQDELEDWIEVSKVLASQSCGWIERFLSLYHL